MKIFNSPEEKLPKSKSMIVWKKLVTKDWVGGPGGELLCKLRIPARARRVEPLASVQTFQKRKCRAEWAVVVSIENLNTRKKVKKGYSLHRADFEYEVGKKVVPHRFNKSERLVCASGIHFFKTKEEAARYVY